MADRSPYSKAEPAVTAVPVRLGAYGYDVASSHVGDAPDVGCGHDDRDRFSRRGTEMATLTVWKCDDPGGAERALREVFTHG